jgi:hypothetical protein
MKDVMTANCQISNEVMLTSNHCAALARELNTMLAQPQADAPAAWIKPDVLATLRGDECCCAFGEQSPKGNLVPLFTRSDAGEVERLRDELESTKAALREEMKDAFEFQQKNSALIELLRETSDYLDGSTRNSVWCDSILHKKMKAAIQPTESGESE